MLSKSQAKAFFIIGTVGFSAIFIGLTIDTMRRIPAQTNSENLTPEVVRGKHLFDTKNCMGCHTILGEGAYYAPELTKVYDRRGEAFVKAMLKDPQAMYPGERKMTQYNLTDEEINDLTQFLKWIGEMDLNGFPPEPDLKISPQSNAAPGGKAVAGAAVQPKIFGQMCTACHAINGQGGIVGPALDDIGLTRDEAYLVKWLKDPMSLKADSKMPKMPLSEKDIAELAKFLVTLKGAQ